MNIAFFGSSPVSAYWSGAATYCRDVPAALASRGHQVIVFLGLSITSSWGNGRASTYRALTRALCTRGHEATFLDQPQ